MFRYTSHVWEINSRGILSNERMDTDTNCKARQCSPLRQKFIERSIINPALLLLMKHLVIGQRQKAHNFSTFHWSPHGSLVSISQHSVNTRVVHLPKRTETSLITESDQAVQAVHSCNSHLVSFLIYNSISRYLYLILNKPAKTFFVNLLQNN